MVWRRQPRSAHFEYKFKYYVRAKQHYHIYTQHTDIGRIESIHGVSARAREQQKENAKYVLAEEKKYIKHLKVQAIIYAVIHFQSRPENNPANLFLIEIQCNSLLFVLPRCRCCCCCCCCCHSTFLLLSSSVFCFSTFGNIEINQTNSIVFFCSLLHSFLCFFFILINFICNIVYRFFFCFAIIVGWLVVFFLFSSYVNCITSATKTPSTKLHIYSKSLSYNLFCYLFNYVFFFLFRI